MIYHCRTEGDEHGMEDKPQSGKKEQEFVEVFNYFENANIRNRNAFSELLSYTMETRKSEDSKKPKTHEP